MATSSMGDGGTPDRAELLHALTRTGCGLCWLSLAAAERYLDGWAYETFTDPEAREALIRAGGFCPRHTWMLLRSGHAFPLASAYRPLLRTQIERMAEGRQGEQAGIAQMGAFWREVGRRLSGQAEAADEKQELGAGRWGACAACATQAEATERAIRTFAEAADGVTFRDAFGASSGFCLAHAEAALRACGQRQPRAVVEMVAERQVALLNQALAALDSFIRSHDDRFRTETRGADDEQWRVALEMVVGRPGVW